MGVDRVSSGSTAKYGYQRRATIHWHFAQLLQKVLSEGDGKTFPKKGDKLKMHYKGTLASNGKKFDSSYDRGQPFSFKIGKGDVIKGWDEGVMEMSLGEKAILHISPDYGYGDQGAGGVIPPNASLDFEVELLQIGDQVAEIPSSCCAIL